MKKLCLWLGTGLLTVVVTAGASVLLAPDEQPVVVGSIGRPVLLTGTEDGARGGWRLAPGDLLTFDLALAVAVDMTADPLAAAGGTRRTSLDLDGRARYEVLTVEDGRARVRLRLDGRAAITVDGVRCDAQPGSAFALALAEGADLELAPDGRVETARLTDPTSQAGRTLALVAGALQVAVPSAGGRAWSARETDTTGPYEASYSARRDVGGVRVEKTKQYEAAAGGQVTLAWSGRTVAMFDDRAGHLVSLGSGEELSMTQGAQALGHARTRVSLTLRSRTHQDPPAPATIPLAAPARPLAGAAPSDERGADARLVAGATVVDLLQMLPDALASGTEAALLVQRKLAALLRLEPDTAAALAAAALTAPSGDLAEDLVLGALGAAGTRDAEAALLEVARARRDAPATLLSLTPALAQLLAPTPAVDALLADVAAGAGEPAAAARLALGAVARTVTPSESERGSRLVADLLADLAAGRGDAAVGLLALGNAADAAALPAIEAHLGVDRPLAERLAAAHALRAVPDRAASLLLGRALVDADPRLRAVAARALSARGARGLDEHDALVALVAAVNGDTEESVRRAALGGLARRTDLTWVRGALEEARCNDANNELRAQAAIALGEEEAP